MFRFPRNLVLMKRLWPSSIPPAHSCFILLVLLLATPATGQSDSDGSGDSSGLFVESGLCPRVHFAECETATIAACYDHAAGMCGEDGVVSGSACADMEIFVYSKLDAVPNCNFCFPNSRCGQTELPFCIDHGGRRRCWMVHVPATLASPPRLVVDLHGLTDTAPNTATYTGWQELADDEGFIVVWPQGTSYLPGQEDAANSWNAGLCCGGSADGAAGVDDVSFLREVVANVTAEFGIDAGRHVYWTGHSNGCAMAQRMAAEAGDVVAAVGCMAMYLVLDEESFADAYRAHGPVPVLEVHGTADGVVGYDDTSLKPGVWGARENLAGWAARNGCAGNATSCWIPAAGTAAGYEIAAHGACDEHTGAALVTLPGVGHNPYPALEPGVPDTTRLAWDFMRRFPAGDGAPGAWHGACDPAGVPEDVVLAAARDESALLVESDQCPAILVQMGCKDASVCYDHTGGCGEDGIVWISECAQAIPTCNACFPNSRCGAMSASEEDDPAGVSNNTDAANKPNGNTIEPAKSPTAAPVKPATAEPTQGSANEPTKSLTATPVKPATTEPTQGSEGAKRGLGMSFVLLLLTVVFSLLCVN